MNFYNKLSQLRCFIKNLVSHLIWYSNGYAMPAPQSVKQNVLRRNSNGEIWIESGTYRGDSTYWISKNFKEIHSIEPSTKYFKLAEKRFSKKTNIFLYNDLSENILKSVIAEINKKYGKIKLSFWLDGHFSAGDTFHGPNDTPILQELQHIENCLFMCSEIYIFIDDFRLFATRSSNDIAYPSKNELINWAGRNGFEWKVEHDIFILIRIL